MFRINGAPVSMRGANLIPMEEMEGRYVLQHTTLIDPFVSPATTEYLLDCWPK